MMIGLASMQGAAQPTGRPGGREATRWSRRVNQGAAATTMTVLQHPIFSFSLSRHGYLAEPDGAGAGCWLRAARPVDRTLARGADDRSSGGLDVILAFFVYVSIRATWVGSGS